MVPGVSSVISGYAGGLRPNPTYAQVSTGVSGHAETVEISFDPQKVSYEELLELFFKIHDPSQKDRQGADIGTQYRSAIFYVNQNQKNKAKSYIEKIRTEFPEIFTEVTKLEKFWPAEEYHQHYFEKHPEQAYCQAVVRPKVEKTTQLLSSRKKL